MAVGASSTITAGNNNNSKTGKRAAASSDKKKMNAANTVKNKPHDDKDSSGINKLKAELDSADSEDSSESESDQDNDDGEEDSHMDECFICEDGGELILCDSCDKAYHAKCVNVDINTLPLTWDCPSCVSEKKTVAKKGTEGVPTLHENAATAITETANMATQPTSNVSKQVVVSTAVNSSKNNNNVVEILSDDSDDSSDDKAPLGTTPLLPTKSKGSANLTAESANTAVNQHPVNPKALYRKQPTARCTVPDCPNKNQRCVEHGKMERASRASDCNNSVHSLSLEKGETVLNSLSKKGFSCQEHANSAEADCVNKESQTGGRVTQAQGRKDGTDQKKANAGNTSNKNDGNHLQNEKKKDTLAIQSPNTSFLTVIIPEGVTTNEIFQVYSKGNVMGVLCPPGVNPGDKLIVMEPGRTEPPVPPKAISEMNERHLASSIINDASESTSMVANVFWKTVWPSLCAVGWTYKRQVHFNFGATTFFPPEVSVMAARSGVIPDSNRPEMKKNVHYFDTIKSIWVSLEKIPKYQKLFADFQANVQIQIARRKKSKEGEEEKKTRKKRVRAEKVSDLDPWKNLGAREYIGIGRQFQVRGLPVAGTSELEVGEKYIQEQLWNSPTSTAVPSLTPSTWHDWAKEPNFVNQFHKSIMKSKKQMRIVASSIDKPVEFCLWYYYHKYKPNKELYPQLKQIMHNTTDQKENSDECAICNEGGELLRCETCTDSYHSACLGLEPSDLEGVKNWSCLTCGKKRKLHLTPSKSPTTRQKGDSLNTKSPTAKNVTIASSTRNLPRPLDMTENAKKKSKERFI